MRPGRLPRRGPPVVLLPDPPGVAGSAALSRAGARRHRRCRGLVSGLRAAGRLDPGGERMTVLTSDRRAALSRRSLWLAYATAGYNLLEGLVAIAAGAAASSTALIG